MASVPDSLIDPPRVTSVNPSQDLNGVRTEVLTESASNAAPPVLLIDPPQGQWTIEQWAGLDREQAVCELVDGCLEPLSMPTNFHLKIQNRLLALLWRHPGLIERASAAGTKLRVGSRTGRIPDLVVARDVLPDDREESLDAAAVLLVVEVISPGRRQRDRDLREKREDYAAAGIDEYWIVDPDALTLLQLRLEGEAYAEVGTFSGGDRVTTPLVEGLVVPVDDVIGSAA